MVQLVEYNEAALGVLAQRPGIGRNLLVGHDDAVHVAWQPTRRGRPARLEVQAEAGGGVGPLELEVAGRRDHHQPVRRVERQVPERCRERERCLAGARGGHRKEVGSGMGIDEVERLLLPATEAYGPVHGTGHSASTHSPFGQSRPAVCCGDKAGVPSRSATRARYSSVWGTPRPAAKSRSARRPRGSSMARPSASSRANARSFSPRSRWKLHWNPPA